MPFYRAYNPFCGYANSFDPVGYGIDHSFPGVGGAFNVYLNPGGQWRRGGHCQPRGPWGAHAGGPHACCRNGQACGGSPGADAKAKAEAGAAGARGAGADNDTPMSGTDNAGTNAGGNSDAPANAAADNSNENTDNPRAGHPHCRRGGARRGGHCRRQQPAPLDGLFETLRIFGGQPLSDAVRELFDADPINQQAAEPPTSSDKTDAAKDEDNTTFSPPIDLFDTDAAWVLHVAVPGADKKDVSVDWDAERGLLSISGVVHRPGDEAFLQSLAQAERRIGLFKRTVKLPPGEQAAAADSEKEKDRVEVDSNNITAKMENGLLVVTVPKAEKEWTEIRTVDVL